MGRSKQVFCMIIVLIFGTLSCSLSGIRQQARSVEQTGSALRTEVGDIVSLGGSLLKTAQALETKYPGVLETAKALATKGAPYISTIQAVSTYHPDLVQTAQGMINKEIPTGEPPADIPIIDQDQVMNFFGSSQYIFYSTLIRYEEVHDFYKTQMPNFGWQFLQSDSNEYANAAQLNYYKDTRTVTINMSLNPLNKTSVVIINILTH